MLKHLLVIWIYLFTLIFTNDLKPIYLEEQGILLKSKGIAALAYYNQAISIMLKLQKPIIPNYNKKCKQICDRSDYISIGQASKCNQLNVFKKYIGKTTLHTKQLKMIVLSTVYKTKLVTTQVSIDSPKHVTFEILLLISSG